MKISFTATILLGLCTTSCTQTTTSDVNRESKSLPLPYCDLIENSSKYPDKNKVLAQSLDTTSVIHTDINSNGNDDFIAILKHSDAVFEGCRHNGAGEFTLLVEIDNLPTIVTSLGIDYNTVPELYEVRNNAFALRYQIGQSIKCDNIAEFAIQQSKIYVSEIQTICYIPNGDIGLQKQSFKAVPNNLIENVQLPPLFADLQNVFF